MTDIIVPVTFLIFGLVVGIVIGAVASIFYLAKDDEKEHNS